jgi:hypothetical protein
MGDSKERGRLREAGLVAKGWAEGNSSYKKVSILLIPVMVVSVAQR